MRLAWGFAGASSSLLGGAGFVGVGAPGSLGTSVGATTGNGPTGAIVPSGAVKTFGGIVRGAGGIGAGGPDVPEVTWIVKKLLLEGC